MHRSITGLAVLAVGDLGLVLAETSPGVTLRQTAAAATAAPPPAGGG
ncbi:hypothetical protein [Streptomyces sp. NPDC053755]